MTYHWLLFDADGTLFDYDRAEQTALRAAFREFGFDCPDAWHARYREINRVLFAELEKGRLTPAQLRTRRFADLFGQFNIQLDPGAFSPVYLGRLSQDTTLVPGALETVRALHPTCHMMIVTNGISEVQRNRINDSDLKPFISDMVVSDEIGCAKPAPEFFDIAFQRMGHPDKSEVIIIGDSLTSDMTGGINYGIDTCWFNPHHEKNSRNLTISHEIDSLEQLIKIVS